MKGPFHLFTYCHVERSRDISLCRATPCKGKGYRAIKKRPGLRGRYTNSSNHSMNSLRSNSISYFVAQIADAIRDSISIQRICIPLKTSSCGMFFNSPYIPHPQYYFSASIPYTKRRPATRSRRDHGSPRRGTGFASHTKTFMERVFPRNKLKASCQDGERFGEWFETPSYEEGARG